MTVGRTFPLQSLRLLGVPFLYKHDDFWAYPILYKHDDCGAYPFLYKHDNR